MAKVKYTKSKERVSKHGEVFTPPRIVKLMCQMLEDENPDCWNKDKTWLEPTCGTGNFLVEILLRKLHDCKHEDDFLPVLASIFAIDIMPDNVQESRGRMLALFTAYCGKEYEAEALEIIETNIICGDSLKFLAEMQEAPDEMTPAEWFAERRKREKREKNQVYTVQ